MPQAVDAPFLPPDPSVKLEAPTVGTRVEPLIGGAAALPRMLADIRAASGPSSFVYLAGWICESDVAVPVAGGIDTLREALKAAAGAGAQVRVMIWAGSMDPTMQRVFSWTEREILRLVLDLWGPVGLANLGTDGFVNRTLLKPGGFDAYCDLDMGCPPAGTHHQKILVVGTQDDVVAYIGGIDFATDRLYASKSGTPLAGAPLFDDSFRLTGPAAFSVLRTFTDRWNASKFRTDKQPSPLRGVGRNPPQPPPSPPAGTLEAQVTHTYAKDCPFPSKIQTAAQAIATVIRSTKQFFYMEDQYYTGTDGLGSAIRDVLRGDPGRWGVVVMASDAAVGAPRPVSTGTPGQDMPYRRRLFLRPLLDEFPGRFFVFERMGDDGTPVGPTAYVHSKLTIVDDVAAIFGTANSNYRSWTTDSEIMLTVFDRSGPGGIDPKDWHPIRAMRAAFWQRHLVSGSSAPPDVGDPAAARVLWSNLWAGKSKGHVRPYETRTPPQRPAWVYAMPADVVETIWTRILDPRN